jgi:hypothetical protein
MKISGLHASASVVLNSLRMRPEHFDDHLTGAKALALFKRSVELIEFETTAYCNRVCSFCPNSFLDRRTVREMPEECWQTILNGLREIDYDGCVVWSRFSEPTSEERLPTRIRQVKKVAPNCRVAINSNGDYLNAERLDDLAKAGLDRLWIDTYFDDAIPPTEEVCMAANEKLLKRIGLEARLVSRKPEFVWDIPHSTIEITSHARNATTMISDMSDRGGLIQAARKTARVAPCYAVYKHLVIDWDGSVMPCCQLRSDSPIHRHAIVGRIGLDLDLVTAYVRLAQWRKALATFGPKEGVCAGCNVFEYEASSLNVVASRVLANVHSGPVAVLRALGSPILKKRQRY